MCVKCGDAMARQGELRCVLYALLLYCVILVLTRVRTHTHIHENLITSGQ